MRSSSLLLALALLTACVPPVAAPSPIGSSSLVPACEYFGARFARAPGWQVEEHREAGEPLSRVSLTGRVGTHQILVSIIPREMRPGVEATKGSQAGAYFQALRSAMTWTDVSDSTFQAPARTYPVLFGREIVRGPVSALDTQQDNTVLLYFPDDFPQGRFFYVFFWTDIHVVGSQPGTLDELRTLVDSFEILSSPAGAPSRGCAG